MSLNVLVGVNIVGDNAHTRYYTNISESFNEKCNTKINSFIIKFQLLN